ncbi:MAG TPA: YihY/virulence factor BrkB family protein [Gaiella sp.]
MDQPTAVRDTSRLARLTRWPLDVMRNLFRVVPAAIDGYFRHRLPQHAAGIAYRVLFSLAPLSIVLVSIAGIVLQNDVRRQQVVDWIVGWVPVSDEGSQSVEEAITRLASPTSALGVFSLLVFIWASTGMMASLRTGLEAALQVERRRPAVRAKLVDLVLVAGAGALLIIAIALTVVAQVVTRFVGGFAEDVGLDNGLFGEVAGIVLPLVVTTFVVMLLYRFVPARRLRFGDAVAGGIVTGILLLAISAASALVLQKVSDLSVVYGSITVVLVFLYSVYLYASAVLLGAEVAAAWSAPSAGPPEPIRVQVKRAVLGLFVHQDPPPQTPEQAPDQPPPR